MVTQHFVCQRVPGEFRSQPKTLKPASQVLMHKTKPQSCPPIPNHQVLVEMPKRRRKKHRYAVLLWHVACLEESHLHNSKNHWKNHSCVHLCRTSAVDVGGRRGKWNSGLLHPHLWAAPNRGLQGSEPRPALRHYPTPPSPGMNPEVYRLFFQLAWWEQKSRLSTRSKRLLQSFFSFFHCLLLHWPPFRLSFTLFYTMRISTINSEVGAIYVHYLFFSLLYRHADRATVKKKREKRKAVWMRF